MAKKLHVSDYLWDPAKYPARSVCVLSGDESYLKHQALMRIRDQILDKEDAEFSLSRFEGGSANFLRVLEEVSTVAMFGGGRRLVVVEDADSFVTKNREPLEKYAQNPSKSGVLLLLLASFPSNTKLYKKLIDDGLVIDCSAMAEKNVPDWIVRWARQRHKVALEPAAANLLVALLGPEIGLLDQEISKLALMVMGNEKITATLVEEAVGSWRTRTTYEMLDCALAGKTAEAIRQLDHLFLAGETAVGILAQISYTLRRMGIATHLILEAESRGKKLGVKPALSQAGINSYFLEKTERQMKQLGRFRGARLASWLTQADSDLKGTSRIAPRLILETLIFKISDPRCKVM